MLGLTRRKMKLHATGFPFLKYFSLAVWRKNCDTFFHDVYRPAQLTEISVYKRRLLNENKFKTNFFPCPFTDLNPRPEHDRHRSFTGKFMASDLYSFSLARCHSSAFASRFLTLLLLYRKKARQLRKD